VTGVDPVATKVEMINQGQTPIIEQKIGDMIRHVVEQGRLRATDDLFQAVLDTDISLVCVGTPSQMNGNLDTSYVRRVCENIGTALKE
jgi:GDP-mannose 6-dehydrogenase